jgi:3'(2'), 5'-bisphosphate nucleotidase
MLNRTAVFGHLSALSVLRQQGAVVPAFDTAACAALMDELTALSARAAQAIKDWTGKGGVRSKADGSPVTAADEAAEAVICDGLVRLAPAVPIISEEQAARENPKIPIMSPAGEGASYFLVDPLDGTREFVAGRDEYTINIALISAGAPILGIITAPASGLTWRGIVGRGAERIALADGQSSPPRAIYARPRPEREVVIMVSRSHLEARTRAFLDGFPQAKLVPCGSSVKFCRLAEGSADLYPRLAPTRDWDVAAGHAILKAAGGHMTAPDGSPLIYGSADLLIPAFVASGDPVTA